jgi:hypothetical protein
VGDRDERDVVVPAGPGAALEVIEAERVFEFAVVLFYAPAQLGEGNEPFDRRVGREVGEPEAGGSILAAGPFGQQPANRQLAVWVGAAQLDVGRSDTQREEA